MKTTSLQNPTMPSNFASAEACNKFCGHVGIEWLDKATCFMVFWSGMFYYFGRTNGTFHLLMTSFSNITEPKE